MRGPAVLPIVIAAGGTGGHFFPAEALASELLSRGRRVALMTDARSGGLQSPVFAGLERFVIRGAGIAGRGAWRAGKQAWHWLAACFRRDVPSRASTPALWLALAAIPVSRRCWRHASCALDRPSFCMSRTRCSAVPIASWRIMPTVWRSASPRQPRAEGGNRGDRQSGASFGRGTCRDKLRAADDIIRLLVLGGSLGARVLQRRCAGSPRIVARRSAPADRVTQQCRPEDLGRVRATYDLAGIDADLSPFFPDVADRLASAHLVIARAGASTVAELAIAGRPSILVPLPGAIDDHQTANARALVEARRRIDDRPADLTPATLRDQLAALLAQPRRC